MPAAGSQCRHEFRSALLNYTKTTSQLHRNYIATTPAFTSSHHNYTTTTPQLHRNYTSLHIAIKYRITSAIYIKAPPTTPLWLLRRRIGLARCGAWSVVTSSGPPRGRGAAMATQITPPLIKLVNLPGASSARAGLETHSCACVPCACAVWTVSCCCHSFALVRLISSALANVRLFVRLLISAVANAAYSFIFCE